MTDMFLPMSVGIHFNSISMSGKFVNFIVFV